MIIRDLIKAFEKIAPPSLAESWDHVGLMVGNVNQELSGVITTLDVTPDTIEFAKEHKANLIISHHPFIFKGLQAVDYNTMQGAMVVDLIKSDIAVYSAHTNLDIAQGGLNDMLAGVIGLTDLKGFVPTSRENMAKVVVFVPTSHADVVRQAMGDAGAGHIGHYKDCSFSVVGEGRFTGDDSTHSYVGSPGVPEVAQEVRIETIVPMKGLDAVIRAMKEAHPYEEVAYDVYVLHEPQVQHTLGRIGQLDKPHNFFQFIDHLREVLYRSQLRLSWVKPKSIQTVAICSGSGTSFIEEAKRRGADAYITGDVKYHDMQLAKELDLLLIDAGHFGTEYIVAKGLVELLKPLTDVPVVAFDEARDFIYYV